MPRLYKLKPSDRWYEFWSGYYRSLKNYLLILFWGVPYYDITEVSNANPKVEEPAWRSSKERMTIISSPMSR